MQILVRYCIVLCILGEKQVADCTEPIAYKDCTTTRRVRQRNKTENRQMFWNLTATAALQNASQSNLTSDNSDSFGDRVVENVSNVTPTLDTIVQMGMETLHRAILGLLMLAIVLGCGPMIGVICSSRDLRTVTNAFVINLLISDLIVALVVIPINFVVPTSLFKGYTTCIYSASMTMVGGLAAICSIFAVAIDRYIAIVSPLRYNTIMTRTCASIFIVVIWLYSILLGCLPLLGWRSYTNTCYRGEVYAQGYVVLLFISGCVIPVWGTLVLYIRILLEARKQARRIRGQEQLTQVTRRSNMNEEIRRQGTDLQFNRDAQRTSTRKSFKTVLIILVYFQISWIPIFVLMIIDAFVNPRLVPTDIHSACGIIAFVNCAVDPFIYGYRNREIRQRVRRLLHV